MDKNLYEYDRTLFRRCLASEVEDLLGYDYADRNGEIRKRIDKMTCGEYKDFLDNVVMDIECDEALWEHFDNSILDSVREYLEL